MGEPGEAIGRGLTHLLFFAGLATIAVTTLVALLVPQATVVGGVTLAIAALLIMPMVVAYGACWVESASGRSRHLSMLVLAMIELRGTTMRTIALAALGALAMFGSVAIGGARGDLVKGFDRHTREWLSNADVWVTTGGEDLMIDSFRKTAPIRALSKAPGVAAVRFHQGGLLDVDGRRLWAIGRPRGDRIMIPPSQLLRGDLDQATTRLRAGGWGAVSDALAKSRDLQVGDAFTMPTPSGPARFRVAAVTTNLGWALARSSSTTPTSGVPGARTSPPPSRSISLRGSRRGEDASSSGTRSDRAPRSRSRRAPSERTSTSRSGGRG